MTQGSALPGDRVLLDTDVFSYLLKGRDHGERYRKHVAGKTVAVSFITVGEIYSGFIRHGVTQATIDAFEAKLHAGIVIVPYNVDICLAYGRLALERTEEGTHRVIAPNDRWIAACAIHHKLPLVTNNAAHFLGITGLTVITESSSPRQPKPGELFT